MVPELSRITGFLLYVQQRLQPLRAQALRSIAVGICCLVKPMRSHTGFCHHMHGLGAHLKLDVGAKGTNQCGVQRLVAIDFRNGNVVLEATGHGFVELMQHAHGCVACGQPAHDDAKAINIGDLCKGQMLVVHLAVNRIKRFFAAVNAHRNMG